MVEPGIYVLATLLQNLLSQHNRGRRRVGEEVVFRHALARANSSPTIISQMEYASLDTQPGLIISIIFLSRGAYSQVAGAYLPRQVASHRHADVPRIPSVVPSPDDHDIGGQHSSRLSTCWKADHDNRYSTRVEQPSGHGAVELGRGQTLVLWHIVDGIDEGRALATVPRCICRNLGRSGAQVSYHRVMSSPSSGRGMSAPPSFTTNSCDRRSCPSFLLFFFCRIRLKYAFALPRAHRILALRSRGTTV